jgi:hypothetical protein
MSSGILGQLYQNNHHTLTVRQNSVEVWLDLFCYAKNLKGNWFYSQEIFYNCIAPTAIHKPEYFAECVEQMVKISGMEIKYRTPFIRAINKLKNFKNKSFDPVLINSALMDIFKAGLQEPQYAEAAIKISGLKAC